MAWKLEPRREWRGSHLLSQRQWASVAAAFKVTAREIEVVRGVFDDRTEKEIAIDLGISENTVHKHMQRIYSKLSVHSRCQLVLRIVADQWPAGRGQGYRRSIDRVSPDQVIAGAAGKR